MYASITVWFLAQTPKHGRRMNGTCTIFTCQRPFKSTAYFLRGDFTYIDDKKGRKKRKCERSPLPYHIRLNHFRHMHHNEIDLNFLRDHFSYAPCRSLIRFAIYDIQKFILKVFRVAQTSKF